MNTYPAHHRDEIKVREIERKMRMARERGWLDRLPGLQDAYAEAVEALEQSRQEPLFERPSLQRQAWDMEPPTPRAVESPGERDKDVAAPVHTLRPAQDRPMTLAQRRERRRERAQKVTDVVLGMRSQVRAEMLASEEVEDLVIELAPFAITCAEEADYLDGDQCRKALSIIGRYKYMVEHGPGKKAGDPVWKWISKRRRGRKRGRRKPLSAKRGSVK